MTITTQQDPVSLVRWQASFPDPLFNKRPQKVYWLQANELSTGPGCNVLTDLARRTGSNSWAQYVYQNDRIEAIHVGLSRCHERLDLRLSDKLHPGGLVEASVIMKNVYFSSCSCSWIGASLPTWDIDFIATFENFDDKILSSLAKKLGVCLYAHPKYAIPIEWESARGWQQAIPHLSKWIDL